MNTAAGSKTLGSRLCELLLLISGIYLSLSMPGLNTSTAQGLLYGVRAALQTCLGSSAAHSVSAATLCTVCQLLPTSTPPLCADCLAAPSHALPSACRLNSQIHSR